MSITRYLSIIVILLLLLIWGSGCAPNAAPTLNYVQDTEAPPAAQPPSPEATQEPTTSSLDDSPAGEDSPREDMASHATQSDLAAKLSGLDIDEFFEASYFALLLRNPELVLEMGVQDQFGIQEVSLTNISDAYIRETQAMEVEILEMLRGYDRSTLTREQQISYDVYEAYLDDQVRGHEFMYYDYPVTFFITGIQVALINFFTDIHPVTDQQDAQNYVTRLEQVDTKFEQLIEGMQLRAQAGVIPPKLVSQWSLGEIQNIARGPATSTPFYSAFQEKVDALEGISEADKQALLDAAEAAIQGSVMPAYGVLAETVEDQVKKAPTGEGVWQYPNGDAYYAYTLRHYTSTDLTADEIHTLGEQELARIHEEMRTIFDELGYPADESLPRLYERVAQDGGFVPGGQMVETYDQIISQAESRLDEGFDLQPKADVIVIGGPVGGFYIPGALDGSRPGAFYAQTNSGSPRFSMPTLAYHETVPGHHYQIAIAQELDMPFFRGSVNFTGYTEGWALYAEQVASELGWYEDDPYGDLGRLQAEAFRAARLVVDTGLHAKEWDFDQAVDYMVENTGLDQYMVQGQIGRYTAWPGQATAYKIGMLKLLELRQLAKDKLGEDFDIKDFHNVVVGNGSMPLDVLESVVDDYIAQ